MDYLGQWQSQILNNAKFSEDLGLAFVDNDLDISEQQIKQDIDEINPIENEGHLELDAGEDVVTNGDVEMDDRRGKVTKSIVHKYFYQVKIYHPVTKKPVNGAICRYCKDKFTCKASTVLKRHLSYKHPEIYKEVQSK